MITSKDLRWMSVALKALDSSNHNKYHMVCVAIKGGKVVSVGVNSKGPPAFFIKGLKEQRGRHAEITCLSFLNKKDIKGATLYIAGKSVGGTIVLSRPCESCLPFIEKMGIRRIVYHNQCGQLIEEKVSEINLEDSTIRIG